MQDWVELRRNWAMSLLPTSRCVELGEGQNQEGERDTQGDAPTVQ